MRIGIAPATDNEGTPAHPPAASKAARLAGGFSYSLPRTLLVTD